MLAIYHFLSLIFSVFGFILSCLCSPLFWLYEGNLGLCLWADQNIDRLNGDYEARIKRSERAFVAYNHGIDILEIERQIRAELYEELQEELQAQAQANSKLGFDSRISIAQLGGNLTKIAEELKK
jgi:predicted DNA-binding protein YlxM (UPF0122 family)